MSKITLNERCSTVLLNKILLKGKDPRSFTIPCTIGKFGIDKALADLGACISLMLYSMYSILDLEDLKPTRMCIELGNKSTQYPRGIAKNVIVKVDKFIFPFDFVVLYMKEDHKIPIILGRLENSELEKLNEEAIRDSFPDEHLMAINVRAAEDDPWYADYIIFLASKIMPHGLTYHLRKQFLSDIKHYIWDDPYLFKSCPGGIIRRCVSAKELQEILEHCHMGPTRGHYGANITAKKIFESGFYWPTIFKDAARYIRECDACQGAGNISSRNQMPLTNILWVEAEALPTNDARVVVKFLRRNRKEWANRLDDTLWAFRTAYKSPIGSTAFRIVYGKACHLPIEMEHKAYWALKNYSRAYKERTKRWHDAKIMDKEFHEGEEVLVFNSMLKLFPGKLKTSWYEPYTVSKVFPYRKVEVNGKNGVSFKVLAARKWNSREIKFCQNFHSTAVCDISLRFVTFHSTTVYDISLRFVTFHSTVVCDISLRFATFDSTAVCDISLMFVTFNSTVVVTSH
ncbi:reverse transcriptase domain-containing protein [Tanacetum coccineum]